MCDGASHGRELFASTDQLQQPIADYEHDFLGEIHLPAQNVHRFLVDERGLPHVLGQIPGRQQSDVCNE